MTKRQVCEVAILLCVILVAVWVYRQQNLEGKPILGGYVSIVRVEKEGVYEVKERKGERVYYIDGKRAGSMYVQGREVKERLEKLDYKQLVEKPIDIVKGVEVIEQGYTDSFRTVGYLWGQGYEEEMSVETAQYVELYLRKEKEILRVVILREKMMVGQLKEGVRTPLVTEVLKEYKK